MKRMLVGLILVVSAACGSPSVSDAGTGGGSAASSGGGTETGGGTATTGGGTAATGGGTAATGGGTAATGGGTAATGGGTATTGGGTAATGGGSAATGGGSGADGGTSSMRCNRTGATIGCYCQPTADASSFPYTDCSHMPDGQRFCAKAFLAVSGTQVPICQCWKQQSQITSTKMMWANSVNMYSDIQDTTTCPPP